MPEQNPTLMSFKPWDAQLAHWLVSPLRNSWVTPNHLTTLRLVVGLAATLLLSFKHFNWGAWLFVASNFLDHTDGELARLSGKSSQLGHAYDLISDAAIHTLLFIGIGYSLCNSSLGKWALVMGIVSGLSVAIIFHLRHEMEQHWGKAATRQPKLAGFEIEDILYLFPLVTITNGLFPFLVAATIGAPAFALWVIFSFYMQSKSGNASDN